MENKLELKHLALYLPYKLKIQDAHDCIWTLHHSIDALFTCDDLEHISLYQVLAENEVSGGSIHKPMLHPLSKYKDIASQAFVDLNCDVLTQIQINELATGFTSVEFTDWQTMEVCFKNHIDVFGLIDKDLAVPLS